MVASLFAPAPPRQSAVTPGEEGWPPAILPPHVSFALDSSYLLDALVPMPLPFFFLFPLPFFFSCCHFFSLLWSFGSWCFRSPLSVAGHLCVFTAPFFHRHLPQWCFRPDLVRASLVDRLRFISLFLLCFLLFFVFVCSPCFLVLVLPCIVLSLFVLCVFYFCNTADLLRVSFAALYLLPGFIPHPSRWIPFGPDLCVVDMYVTLAFGSRRKIGLDFYVVDKCVS
jgi:hypothetical protein